MQPKPDQLEGLASPASHMWKKLAKISGQYHDECNHANHLDRRCDHTTLSCETLLALSFFWAAVLCVVIAPFWYSKGGVHTADFSCGIEHLLRGFKHTGPCSRRFPHLISLIQLRDLFNTHDIGVVQVGSSALAAVSDSTSNHSDYRPYCLVSWLHNALHLKIIHYCRSGNIREVLIFAKRQIREFKNLAKIIIMIATYHRNR